MAHETAQQQNAASQAAKEERAKAELKAKEDLSVKLQYCKDERDLFKVKLFVSVRACGYTTCWQSSCIFGMVAFKLCY